MNRNSRFSDLSNSLNSFNEFREKIILLFVGFPLWISDLGFNALVDQLACVRSGFEVHRRVLNLLTAAEKPKVSKVFNFSFTLYCSEIVQQLFITNPS